MNQSKYEFIPSPNFDSREENDIYQIVLHYTVGSFESTKSWFLNTSSDVSAHYVIDTDGTIIQMVEEDKRAWHAGISYWKGKKNLNYTSLGIEIVNAGWVEGNQPSFPEVQMQSVVSLTKELMEKYKIQPENIISHSDVSPARKIDTGPIFPWQKLAEENLVFIPNSSQIEKQIVPTNFSFQEALVCLGYNPENYQKAIKAFKLRYAPQEWIGQNWEINETNKKMILALLKKMNHTSEFII